MINILLITFLVVAVQSEPPAFRLASYYGNHMVLQMEPHQSIIWGYGEENADIEVNLKGKIYTTTTYQGVGNIGWVWKVTLDAMSPSGPFNVEITHTYDEVVEGITLEDVLFGDVYLCSGQSNMLFTVSKVNTVAHGAKLYFSAVCWFYGRNLYDHLKYPIGLIASSWGGTPIEAWSSPDSLKACNRTETDSKISLSENMSDIFGYGEANTFPGIIQDSYSCTFPAMIADWRNKFYIGTGGTTDKLFPFGFVQLGTDSTDSTLVDGYPALRWHQTADYGYVPNEKMPNVFMAVAMDLGDPKSPWGIVHSRYKQDVGYRLALAGKAIAYNEKYVNYSGPFPNGITIRSLDDVAIVTYDSKHIQVNHDSGFEVCCSSTNNCTYLSTDWLAAPITSIIGTNGVQISTKHCSGAKLQAIRYAWRDCPCVYKQCTIYDKDSNLPAPLFVFSLKEKIVKWIN
ncbi:sialate O-acetylesterase-like [Saccoglossus kowalevskii]|uniref:Sialate O-acetylesterase-like n=1 Tax=Saccoglossus kowalevskii TaxID=10224 RepID=A0ABM0LUF3_SACKO|nr:PREDICTED: sialate O-acetylesterase-like [Saccoglossus kowalevskii]